MYEIDRLARDAITGQSMLRRWADTLASGDPFIEDDSKLFCDLAKVGKAETFSNTIGTFGRESRTRR
jgi:hypothetical protein